MWVLFSQTMTTLYDCHLGWQIIRHPDFRDVKKFLSVFELKNHGSKFCKTSVFNEAFRNSGCSQVW